MNTIRIEDIMKPKLFIVLLAIIVSTDTFASRFEKVKVGEIYYEIDTDYKTAEVTNSRKDGFSGEQSYCGLINIPSAIYYEGEIYEVVEIGLFAFSYSKHLRVVTIPNSVKRIGASAFQGCGELTTVILPKNLRRIEEYTFDGCRKLDSISLSNNLTFIGYEAFAHCWSIKTLHVPNSVRKIELNAFYMVNNVIYHGQADGSSLWGAKNINKSSDGYLIFTDKRKTVVESCAKHASGEIRIPQGVTRISANAFEKCTSIRAVEIPNTVKYIEYGAFAGCSELQKLTIPKSVQTIEVEVFRGCKALTLRIPEKFKGELGTIDCQRIIYY